MKRLRIIKEKNGNVIKFEGDGIDFLLLEPVSFHIVQRVDSLMELTVKFYIDKVDVDTEE